MFGKKIYEPGDRVLAILEADMQEKAVTVLGEGTYEGFFERHDDSGKDPIPRRAALMKLVAGHSIGPRIRLDSGEVVWGDECHWGDIRAGLEWLRQFVDVKTTTMAAAKAAAKAEADAASGGERLPGVDHGELIRSIRAWREDPMEKIRSWRCE